MKKIITILLFSIILSPIFSRDFHLYQEECFTENSYNDKLSYDTFDISYSPDFNAFYISRNDGFILLSDEAIDSIRSAIEKYFEWEEIAINNKSTIEKALPIKTFVGVIWTDYSDEACMGGENLEYIFFSQNLENHQLVLRLPKVTPLLGNDYSSFKMDKIYLSKKMVQNLYTDLSKESLNKKLEEVKKQEDIESLFN